MRRRSHKRDDAFPSPVLVQILKNQDGTFAMLNWKGKVLKNSIPDWWLEEQLLKNGYCGEEYQEIRRQLDGCGKAEVVLGVALDRPWHRK